METSYLQALMQQGIAAAKAGQQEQARHILTQVIEADETIVQAWLWLSSVVDDPTDKFICLQNVLKLDPSNKPAQIGLARLEGRAYRPQPPQPPPASVPSDPSPPSPAAAVKTGPAQPEAAESPAVEAKSTSTPRSPAGQYKKLQPASTPRQPVAKKPAHLREHPSIAAALLKKESADRHPPPPEESFDEQADSEHFDLPPTPKSEFEEVTPRRPADPKITLLRVGIFLFALLLAAPCSLLGGIGAFNEVMLRRQGEIVEAHVTEQRISRHRKGFEVYEVQYRFSLDGKTWYWFADETGQADRWAAVPKSNWDTAWSTKRLEVLYLPGDPAVNRPLAVAEHVAPLGDPLRAVSIAVAVSSIFLVGGISLTMFFPRRSPKPTLPERTAGTRYKRVAPKTTGQPAPVKRAAHLQEHVSMAAAVMQRRPPAREMSTTDADAPRSLPVGGAGDVCPFCRRSISATTTFCSYCHLPLVVDCPACGSRQDVEWENCTQCNQAIGDYRRQTAYFAGLATAYHQHEQFQKSIKTWRLVEMLRPDYPQLRLRQAEALAGSGRSEKALAMLRQVLAENPGQTAASLVLGKILQELSYWDEARTVYEQALVVSPAEAELHFALGWLLMEQGYLKKGFAHIRKTTQLDPQHGMAWYRLAQLYEVSQKSKPAVAAYRKAAALLPENTLAHLKAQSQVGVLDPDLPQVLATGWFEFARQAAGPMLICIVTALLDSGLRPWWIPWTGWVALFLGALGTLLWISGASLPRNPAICFVAGPQGVSSSEARLTAAVLGGICWLGAMVLILYPIGQSYPEVPEWISKL